LRISPPIKNWYLFSAERIKLQQEHVISKNFQSEIEEEEVHLSLIDHCGLEPEENWSSKCPKLFKKLQVINKSTSFCQVCNKNVLLVKDVEDYLEKCHVKKGLCVAFFQTRVGEVVAKFKHKGYLGIDYETKEHYDETGPFVTVRKCW